MTIDWTNKACPISKYYTVREAIYLPRWGRMADETDGLDDNAKAALVDIFKRMDAVTDMLGVKVTVHCAFRSNDYNKLVGGSKASAHMARGVQMPPTKLADGTEIGNGIKPIAAVDFDASMGEVDAAANCNQIRAILEPKLADLGLRMEDNPDSDWTHVDTKPVAPNGSRTFKP